MFNVEDEGTALRTVGVTKVPKETVFENKTQVDESSIIQIWIEIDDIVGFQKASIIRPLSV